MRHQNRGRKLGRNSAHRKALYSNLVSALLTYERIETTEAKAKELKRLADRTISWGMQVVPLTEKAPEKRTPAEKAEIVHCMRMARRIVRDADALRKLFHDVALRNKGRQGGYTRMLKTRNRPGDAAPMAYVELVERRAPEPAAAAKTE